MTKLSGILLALAVSVSLTACNEKEAIFEPAVSALIQKADTLHQAGQTAQAICRLEAAADISPDTYQVQYNLGVLYTETHEWSKATSHLEKAVQLNPSQPNNYYSLGYAYEAWGDQLKTPSAGGKSNPKTQYAKAIEAYKQFLKTTPDTDTGRQNAQAELTRLKNLTT